MDNLQRKRPLASVASLGALALQGISGIAGGIGLVSDPAGEAVGLPRVWLFGSPFQSYLISGLVLLVILGILALIVVYGLWPRRRWGWMGPLLVGVALLVWIAVQIRIVGCHPQPPLQLIYGAFGSRDQRAGQPAIRPPLPLVDIVNARSSAALAASAAFVMPVARPPNAIVFASRRLTIPQMARSGIALNLLFIPLIARLSYAWRCVSWCEAVVRTL